MRASSAHRIALCPGSWQAEQGLPDKPSEAAQLGTDAHALLAYWADNGRHVSPADVSDEVYEVAEALWSRFEREVVQGAKLHIEAVEVELGSKTNETDWTGHADLVFRLGDGPDLHVVDWKTGWGDVPEADENAQMRVYACLVDEAFPAVQGTERAVYCHVVTRSSVSSVRYTTEAIYAAWDELTAIFGDAMKLDAPRKPSPEACKFCRALGTTRCPETLALPEKVAEALPVALEQPAAITSERLSELLRAASLVEKLAKGIRDEAKSRLDADPESVPGWKLKPGAVRRSISDTPCAIERLIDAGIPESAVIRACSLSLPDAAKIAADVLNKKRKEGEAIVNEALTGLIEEKQTAPSLVEA